MKCSGYQFHEFVPNLVTTKWHSPEALKYFFPTAFDIMNKGTKKESNENISDQETQIINKLHIQMIRF